MTDFHSEFVEFSNGESMTHPEGRDLLLYAAGCHQASWSVLEVVLEKLQDPDVVATMRKTNWNLGMLVAGEIERLTRDGFSWDTVSQIIALAGKRNISLSCAQFLEARYPLSLGNFCFYEDLIPIYNVKDMTRKMAKIVLWVEVMSFLLLKNYDLRLSQGK